MCPLRQLQVVRLRRRSRGPQGQRRPLCAALLTHLPPAVEFVCFTGRIWARASALTMPGSVTRPIWLWAWPNAAGPPLNRAAADTNVSPSALLQELKRRGWRRRPKKPMRRVNGTWQLALRELAFMHGTDAVVNELAAICAPSLPMNGAAAPNGNGRHPANSPQPSHTE